MIFHPNRMSWSYRNLGNVARSHIMNTNMNDGAP